MFKKHLISLILLWLILVLGCLEFLYHSSIHAKMAYQGLMNYSNQFKKNRLKEEALSTQQMRYQVSKQILYKKELQRMQSRLISDYSDLIYSKKKGELVEHFKGLTFVVQEKLIGNSNREEKTLLASSSSESIQQVIRQFKAKDAIYSYKSGQLEAEEVEVTDYLLPGHVWPHSLETFSPILQGQARTIHFSLFAEIAFKAQGFQAIFHGWEDEW